MPMKMIERYQSASDRNELKKLSVVIQGSEELFHQLRLEKINVYLSCPPS
jgi:hypothetical protein